MRADAGLTATVVPEQYLMAAPPFTPTESVTGIGIEMIDCAALCLRTGRIVAVPRPGRHGDVIRHMIDALGLTREDVGYSIQGFTTTHGRFVGRSIAFLIATDAEQLMADTRTGNGIMQLFSEDVW